MHYKFVYIVDNIHLPDTKFIAYNIFFPTKINKTEYINDYVYNHVNMNRIKFLKKVKLLWKMHNAIDGIIRKKLKVHKKKN